MRPLHIRPEGAAGPLWQLWRALAAAAAAVAAAEGTPGTRAVGLPPSARSGTRTVAPESTEQATQAVSRAKDGAVGARFRALAAAAHLRAAPKAAPRRPLVGWRGGQRPRLKQRALGRSHGVGAVESGWRSSAQQVDLPERDDGGWHGGWGGRAPSYLHRVDPCGLSDALSRCLVDKLAWQVQVVRRQELRLPLKAQDSLGQARGTQR